MKYYSINKTSPATSLRDAVIKGLAPDKGLYMPEIIKRMPDDFFNNIQDMSFQEISYEVAKAFFGDDINAENLKHIVHDTLSFDCPVVHVNDNIWSLELFHGPTLAFKDVGARFMARMLAYYLDNIEVNVLVMEPVLINVVKLYCMDLLDFLFFHVFCTFLLSLKFIKP